MRDVLYTLLGGLIGCAIVVAAILVVRALTGAG
jgi:hypothetical protein